MYDVSLYMYIFSISLENLQQHKDILIPQNPNKDTYIGLKTHRR